MHGKGRNRKAADAAVSVPEKEGNYSERALLSDRGFKETFGKERVGAPFEGAARGLSKPPQESKDV